MKTFYRLLGQRKKAAEEEGDAMDDDEVSEQFAALFTGRKKCSNKKLPAAVKKGQYRIRYMVRRVSNNHRSTPLTKDHPDLINVSSSKSQHFIFTGT
jgi:hypothetical protein